MGKRHFKGNNSSEDRKRRRDHAEKWKSTRGDDPNSRQNQWNLTKAENARFEAFYKAQHFVHTTEDWQAFMQTLREPLPACFRINPDYAFASDLREQLLSFMGDKLVVDDVEIKAVEQIRWFPNGYGYQLGTDRKSIRKLPALNQLHKWMVQHTDNGNLTRQEAVSMVPPIALNVEPHHRCLDMCAAPGSKTSQLLEVVNRSLEGSEEQQGLVVANDADTDRAYMLVHQCRRINSPLLVITTHKGQLFPTIREEGQYKSEFFDRVLCDVPCSGDGTLRKNPTIWSRWNTSMGVTLHPLQLMIARRGLQVLKTDGLMVYSTCSLSPYEDEAVVAELLRANKGTLELVDARQFMPLFKARPGLESWYVLDDHFALKKEIRIRKAEQRKANEARKAAEAAGEEGDVAEDAGDNTTAAPADDAAVAGDDAEEEPKQDFSNVEDAELRACLEMGFLQFKDFSEVPQNLTSKLRKSLFPPTAEEREWMHLERCLRCVPQDEDTGGFFVATLRKVAKPVDAKQEAAEPEITTEAVQGDEADSAAAEAAAQAAENTDGVKNGEDEEPKQEKDNKFNNRGLVEYQPWDIESFNKIKEFYKLDDKITHESFFIREDIAVKSKNQPTTGSKTIYFIPKSVRTLMEGDQSKQLKTVMSGIKAFEKKINHQNGQVEYRLIQDGVERLVPHVNNRKINVNVQDFCNILGGGLVSFTTMSAPTIQQLCTLPAGVVICTYTYDPADYIAPTSTSQAIAESEAEAPAANGEEKIEENIELGKVSGPRQGSYHFHVVCWRGTSRTINVMCGKVDIEMMKHQLAALNVLRPKISAAKKEETGASTNTEEGSAEVAAGEEVAAQEMDTTA